MKNLEDRSGMSFVSVLAGLAVVGVLVAGVITIEQDMFQISKNIDTQSEIPLQPYTLQASIPLENTCNVNVKSMALSSNPPELAQKKFYFPQDPNVFTLGNICHHRRRHHHCCRHRHLANCHKSHFRHRE